MPHNAFTARVWPFSTFVPVPQRQKKRVDWWSHRDKNGRAGQTFSEKILTSAILQSTGFELSCLGLPWVAMICWADSRLSPAAVCGVRHVLWKICETLINFLHCLHRRLQRIWLCWLFFFFSKLFPETRFFQSGLCQTGCLFACCRDSC